LIEALIHFQGLVGLLFVLLVAWALSESRSSRPSFRWIGGAVALQIVIALAIVRVPIIWSVIGLANTAVQAVEKATLVGSSYMFGYTGGAEVPFDLEDGVPQPVIIAFQILPLVIVLSALSALFWHWGVLRLIVRGLSWALQKTLGVSGVVGLSGGANLFLGVVESPMVVRGYLERMTRAELFTVMVLAMSTVSGAILILYSQTLSQVVPNAVGHMISASLISLPAAILIARLMVPGGGDTATQQGQSFLKYDSSIDAITRGTMDGVQLFLAVIGVIIVVFALVNLVDQMLAVLSLVDGEAISLKRIMGWVFAPLMWMLGVPWEDAPAAGALMGTKSILNEYVAYLDLAAMPVETFDLRSRLIVIYALCGFANLASVGLLVSTIGTLAPARRSEVAALGMKSWVAGNLASAMTGAVIGLVTFA